MEDSEYIYFYYYYIIFYNISLFNINDFDINIFIIFLERVFMHTAETAHRAYLSCFGGREEEGGREGREFLESWERGEDSWEGVVFLLNGLSHEIVEK